MIQRRTALSAALAMSLIAVPAVSQAAPPIAAPAPARTASSVQGEHLFGFGAGWVIALLIVAAVVVILVTNHHGTPASP